MEMKPEHKKIYKNLNAEQRREFREAIELDDKPTIAKYTYIPPEGDRERGRPNLGLTDDNKQAIYEKNKAFRRIEQKEDFNPEIVGAAGADLDQIQNFKDLYQMTIDQVKANFFIENEFVLNKHPSIWYNRLLMALKKELPRITIKEPERAGAAWECFKGLMYDISLFPTREAFQNLTDLYIYEVNRQVSPEWVAIKTKMIQDCEMAMRDQVNTTPLTQVNKLFILKAIYGYSENGPQKDNEIERKARNINELPFFGGADPDENE